MMLVGLVACGRIGFDPAGDGGDGSGSDAAATCADQPELCNGIDDNCNGQVDEGCPCTPFSVALGQSATSPQLAAAVVVSTGTDYIVYDLAAAALVHVDYSGNLGATVPLAFDGMYDRIVWDGAALIHGSIRRAMACRSIARRARRLDHTRLHDRQRFHALSSPCCASRPGISTSPWFRAPSPTRPFTRRASHQPAKTPACCSSSPAPRLASTSTGSRIRCSRWRCCGATTRVRRTFARSRKAP